LLLAFDIGNTNIKTALFDGEEIRQEWRLSTDITRTGDEYFSMLSSLFHHAEVDVSLIKSSVLSSVVPPLIGPFITVTQRLTGKKPLIVSPSMYRKLPVGVPQPVEHEIGTDLLCDAVAAWCIYEEACIIVDFGTALSFIAVADDGMIEGIAISPGIGTALKSLYMNTAQLPSVPLEVPASSLGMNTVESIQAGIVLGYKSLVEGLINRMKNDLALKRHCNASRIHVIATGGLNSMLQPITDIFERVDKELTLTGLRKIYEFVSQ